MIDDSWQIAGIVVSFLSLFVTIGLVMYVRHLDGKQRKRDEQFYITATMKDVLQLKDHLINIQDISESTDSIPDNDEKVEITRKLINYSEKNKKLIESVIADTRFSMSRWMSLDESDRRNVENLIDTTNWVLSNYLPKTDESMETQLRRWSSYLTEFEKRKSMSSQKIEDLISKYPLKL